MLTTKDRNILEHILEYCEQIKRTVDRFVNSFDAFKDDFVYRNAIALCILQIGELTGNLADEYKSEHPEMPWRQIKAVRNIIAHHYGSVDSEVTWDIVTDDIPNLIIHCHKQLVENN